MIDDTIAAISTPPGEGGIGIVRISGPAAFSIGRQIFLLKRKREKIKSHYLYYGHVVDPKDQTVIDEALISFMRAPHTYTKEDVVEVNCHGGIMPLAKTLEVILACGARLAEPGEFTQRAFLNGRLDLAQAEAVIQIIRAKTETAMRLGVNQLSGGLSQKVKAIRQTLLSLLAQVEASIDFPEHQDVEEVAREEIASKTKASLAQIEELLATAHHGRILREGLRTVIVGKPNVGKSSLLNALLREQRAIVTNIPGTTRDVLEESINLGGIALTITDTAGIRTTEDEVEKIGVERSLAALQTADLILFVVDSSQEFSRDEEEIWQEIATKPCIVIANKIDLLTEPQEKLALLAEQFQPKQIVAMSLLYNEGIGELEEAIKAEIFQGKVPAVESAMVTSTRHKDALRRAKEALLDLTGAVKAGVAVDLLAIDLHTAVENLGEITGEAVSADLTREIFSTFCIGK